eukprot:scaffold1984_cov130-Isochrysis_galbana.AAC.2
MPSPSCDNAHQTQPNRSASVRGSAPSTPMDSPGRGAAGSSHLARKRREVAPLERRDLPLADVPVPARTDLRPLSAALPVAERPSAPCACFTTAEATRRVSACWPAADCASHKLSSSWQRACAIAVPG